MRTLAALVAMALLAGCSDSPSGKDDALDRASSGTSTTKDDAAPQAPQLPPLEVFNATLTFPSASGGSAGSGSFDVPPGYGNVTVTLVATGQCPGYVKGAGVGVTIGALDETIAVPARDFAPDTPAVGYGPYGCAVNDYVMHNNHRSGTASMTWTVQPGTGSLEAHGEFTGEALVIVVAAP